MPQRGQACEHPGNGPVVGAQLVTVVETELLKRFEFCEALGAGGILLVVVAKLAVYTRS